MKTKILLIALLTSLLTFNFVGAQSESLAENSCTLPTFLQKPLKRGSRGEDVKQVQKYLFEKTYLKATPNGNYGPATVSAVKKYQSNNNLIITGIVGGVSLEHMKLSCGAISNNVSPLPAKNICEITILQVIGVASCNMCNSIGCSCNRDKEYSELFDFTKEEERIKSNLKSFQVNKNLLEIRDDKFAKSSLYSGNNGISDKDKDNLKSALKEMLECDVNFSYQKINYSEYKKKFNLDF